MTNNYFQQADLRQENHEVYTNIIIIDTPHRRPRIINYTGLIIWKNNCDGDNQGMQHKGNQRRHLVLRF